MDIDEEPKAKPPSKLPKEKRYPVLFFVYYFLIITPTFPIDFLSYSSL